MVIFKCKRKQITTYSGAILSRNTCRKIGSNAFEKKERLCPFSSSTARRKKPKKSFSLVWSENLAESNKGSYFDQEQWLKELNEQPSVEYDPSVFTSTFSARRSKIPENYGWRTSWRSAKWKHWNTAKAPWPCYRGQWKTAGEDQRIGDLSLLSRKSWTCGKFTNLVPLGTFSARTKAVHHTKLILHFWHRKKAGCSR